MKKITLALAILTSLGLFTGCVETATTAAEDEERGLVEQNTDGSSDGNTDGNTDGSADGSSDGNADGNPTAARRAARPTSTICASRCAKETPNAWTPCARKV